MDRPIKEKIKEKMKKVLTKVGGSGILTERLAEGTEDQRELKKCLTNVGARGKLNEFAPEGVNRLEKGPEQGDRG